MSYAKFIGLSVRKKPVLATLKGIMEVPEDSHFQILYTTSEVIEEEKYNEQQHVLKVENVKGKPAIPGRDKVTVQTPSGPVTDEAIPEIPAVPAVNNYENFLDAYKKGTQYEFALSYIEKNHVIA